MQQVARPGLQPLEYAVPASHQRSWRWLVALGVCHLLASIFVTWLLMEQEHAHSLHSHIPLNPLEQSVEVVTPVLLFPFVDLYIWCVHRLDLGQSLKVAFVILAFLADSMAWVLMASLVLKLLRRCPAAQ